MQSKSFKLNILSLEKELFSGEAVSLTVKAIDGELSVLAGHAPMVAILQKGPIRIKKIDGQSVELIADKGLLKASKEDIIVFI